eukprot:5466598-Amphidinium_carterae.1
MAKHMERLTETLATLRATLRFNPDGPADRNSAGARQSQGGGVHCTPSKARVESGGTRSSLPTTQEAKACDAFRETIGAADHDE